MPKHDLYLGRTADADLQKLDAPTLDRVNKKFREIATRPELGKPLKGPLSGLRSVRVGGLRIVYGIDAQERSVTIWSVKPRQAGKRADVYRDATRRR